MNNSTSTHISTKIIICSNKNLILYLNIYFYKRSPSNKNSHDISVNKTSLIKNYVNVTLLIKKFLGLLK